MTDPVAGWLGISGLPQPQWARDVDQLVTSATTAATWLAELPPDVRSRLLMSTVRCDGGKTLLRLYRIPTSSKFVRGRQLFRRRFLAVPTSRATWNDGRPSPPMWVITLRDSWVLRCRCHRPAVTVTAAELTGDRPMPGAHVVLSVPQRR
ncbi:hypothetical protein JD79_04115 [Geodermatophilus normandii]|uniref:Uncharacterized protein n=1 Tax=Geodermatophilus normandii TaxID=1137989 RepID=A0A317QPJ3_9ACTN|nr:hypothetical protein [Geodermatophilus normandii]PWW24923.1 hypothetical protein JD79_04115 [Geodermatophilus normandii]